VYLDANACICEAAFSIDSLKVEVACVYNLQILDEKSSKGCPCFLNFDKSYSLSIQFFFVLFSIMGTGFNLILQ
jgi:hypothetical protein